MGMFYPNFNPIQKKKFQSKLRIVSLLGKKCSCRVTRQQSQLFADDFLEELHQVVDENIKNTAALKKTQQRLKTFAKNRTDIRLSTYIS